MNLDEAKHTLTRIPPPSGLMRVSQAASILGLNPETIRKRIRRGQLTAWGRRGTLHVALADVLPQFDPRAEANGK
jgi:hypothetical protein